MAAWERRGLATERYDFLVIDEVQDVTPVELRLALATLKDKHAFLLCGDSNQIVHPNLFSWARVKSLFHGEGGRQGAPSPLDRIHLLSANYRNTRAVTALANRLLLIKQRRFGSVDRESNYLVEAVSGEEGRVELLADGPGVRAELEARTRRSARTAVVVLRDEDKPAARAAFSTPLLFSVQEAKGLEYENVVLFNLVSGAAREYRECAAGVEPADLDGGLDYARARDKSDKSLDAYKFYVNALYVAMTRAVRSLVVVEADPGHPLLALLAVGQAGDRVELAAEESSREEWQREARRLELQGKVEQAEQIRREILEVRPVPWEVADAAALPGLRARALGPGPIDKAAQQLLFEFAVTYDVPSLLPRLVAAGFRHAKKAESGRAYIESTHYAEYRPRRSPRLQDQLRAHGLDFRNPLNETPLMVAARLGRHDLVTELLAQGADGEATDTAGRTALRVALAAWLDQRGVKATAFEQVWEQLATAPLKVKLGDRMVKLDPTAGEWLLVQLGLVEMRRMVDGAARLGTMPFIDAATLARLVASLPPATLPAYRRRREYLSSLLAKNEIGSTNPYGRRLFQRVRRGAYVLCPALEVEVKGEWIPVSDAMGFRVAPRRHRSASGADRALDVGGSSRAGVARHAHHTRGARADRACRGRQRLKLSLHRELPWCAPRLKACSPLILALGVLLAWGCPQPHHAAGAQASAPADLRGTYRLHGRAHVSAGAALNRDLEVRADGLLAPGSSLGHLRIRLEQGGYACELASEVGPGGRLAFAPGQRCTLRLQPPDGPGQVELELVGGEGRLTGDELTLHLSCKVSGSVSLRSVAGDLLGEAGLNLPAVPVRGEARATVAGHRDRSRAAQR